MTENPTTRIPNLGHAAILLGVAVLSFFLAQAAVFAVASKSLADQRLQLLAQILGYLIALTVAAHVFRALWQRPALAGLRWNASAARPKFIALGILLGLLSQAADSLFPVSTPPPIDALFHTHTLIVVLFILAVLAGPIFEEVLFRGFLLPAFAIAFDFLTLRRTLESLEAWRSDETFTRPAMVVASILTSLLFAVVHGVQLDWNPPALTVLFGVSLLLCAIRFKTRSVAAVTLVHIAYNATVFATLAIVTHGFHPTR